MGSARSVGLKRGKTTVSFIDEGLIEATFAPTYAPTFPPSPAPTLKPTPEPSPAPTFHPTLSPTPVPTDTPTAIPSPSPTSTPTLQILCKYNDGRVKYAPAPKTSAAPSSAPPGPSSAAAKEHSELAKLRFLAGSSQHDASLTVQHAVPRHIKHGEG